MRLIHTETLQLQSFEHANAPRYAILSHTWGKAEITLQDFLQNDRLNKAEGFWKVEQSCRIAAEAGFDYLWIDTCCIDKTNSSELGEAINSMFAWYRDAAICYAYLADVSPAPAAHNLDFTNSRWFTRGWTLQELLAPSEVIFLAEDWSILGSKRQLVDQIASASGIPPKYLMGEDISNASVAQRMSWASSRSTSKPEDIAYCLLGIFDLSMSLVYGEGPIRAFRRLQELIIKDSDDQSIFAWARQQTTTRTIRYMRYSSMLLADTPSDFRASGTVIEANPPQVEGFMLGIRTATEFGNRGMQITLPLIHKRTDEALAVLACTYDGMPDSRIALYLQDMSTNGGRYERQRTRELENIPMDEVLSSAAYKRLFIATGNRAKRFSPSSNFEVQVSSKRDDSVLTPVIPEEKQEAASPAEPARATVNLSTRPLSNWLRELTPKLCNPQLGSWSTALLIGGCAFLLVHRQMNLLERLKIALSATSGAASP